MGRCFNFVIRMFDEEGLRYYGDGALVAEENVIEGYVANDYLLMAQEANYCDILFVNQFDGISVSITVKDMVFEFPNNYIINTSGYYTRVMLEVSSEIKDVARCRAIKRELNKVKSLYR